MECITLAPRGRCTHLVGFIFLSFYCPTTTAWLNCAAFAQQTGPSIASIGTAPSFEIGSSVREVQGLVSAHSLPTANSKVPTSTQQSPSDADESAQAAEQDDDYTTQAEYDEAEAEDKVAREQEYGEQRTDTTRAFLRTLTPLLRRGQWQWDFGLSYTTNELTTPVLLGGSILADRQFQIRNLDSLIGFRAGLSDRLQWFGSTTVGWQTVESADSGGSLFRNDTGGLGDLRSGVNFLLFAETSCSPAVITSFDVTAPTGNPRNPLLISDAGTGIGAWSFSTDVLMVKAYDPLVVFWGAGYRFFTEDTHNGVNVELGDAITYTFGTGFGVNERVTLSSTVTGSYIFESRLNSNLVAGSNADIIALRLAATVAKNCNIVEPFVQFGLTDRAPDASLGVVWTY
ncbi:MAG: hypothetical protein AB8B50_20615 [Pirellulaceae bacterium]